MLQAAWAVSGALVCVCRLGYFTAVPLEQVGACTFDVIREKEISKPCRVRAGKICGKRLQEVSPGDFSDAECQGGKGIQRLEPGKAVLGSWLRQLLLPAFQVWVQLIAPHHCRVELLHTHPMGMSLPWWLSFQGRQGVARCEAVFLFGEGRKGSICIARVWFWEEPGASCPVGPIPLANTGGGSSEENGRSHKMCCGLLFLGHITPNSAGGTSCLPCSRDNRQPAQRDV